jgi:hypothetical protein
VWHKKKDDIVLARADSNVELDRTLGCDRKALR